MIIHNTITFQRIQTGWLGVIAHVFAFSLSTFSLFT
jgi:hypothetical protein